MRYASLHANGYTTNGVFEISNADINLHKEISLIGLRITGSGSVDNGLTSNSPDNFEDDQGHELWSGDGSAGSTGVGFRFHFSILTGDSNQDGVVDDVIISGSISLHDAYSFDAAEIDGTSVIGSGLQLVTIPVGGADTITIVFSEEVNVGADCLDIIGLTTVNEPVLVEFSRDTNSATWRFEGWALGDRHLLSVSDAVTDVEGNCLDGEWINPASMSTTSSLVSEFPSGDGNPGGNFHFMFTLLPGDANLDLVVNASDMAILSGNWDLGIHDLSALFENGDL